MIRRLGNVVAVVITMAVVVVASTLLPTYGPQWGIYPATVVLFLIALCAVGWLHNKMKERLGDDAIPNKGWLKELYKGKPIAPKYGVSEGIPEQDLFIDEHDHAFFNDFADFARTVNKWLAYEEGPWRLQEDRKTEIGDRDDDQPVYGRGYRIFFNQKEVGTLKIRPQFEYSSANPQVIAKGEIEYPRLFPFYRITALHNALSYHLVEDRSHQTSFLYSLMEVMWREGSEAFKHSNLEFELQGIASYYLHMLQNARQHNEVPVT
jgi:hypothetical protein